MVKDTQLLYPCISKAAFSRIMTKRQLAQFTIWLDFIVECLPDITQCFDTTFQVLIFIILSFLAQSQDTQ